MSDQERRAFLKKLALGAVYAAPLVYSTTLPQRAMASHKPSHCPPGQGCVPDVAPQSTPTGGLSNQRSNQSPSQAAPWDAPAPGTQRQPAPRRPH